MNIPHLLQQDESETLEFKASFGDEALESIGAFANARGGTVLIGVEDDRTIRGVHIGEKTLEDWANRIQEATDPRLQPSFTCEEDDRKSVISIQIEPVTGAPVSVRGRYFRRIGRTNQRMSHEEIMQRMLTSAGLSWDAVVEREASWSELHAGKIQHFMMMARRTGRRPFPEETNKREMLERLRLLQDGRPTRAALLLFGKTPLVRFPSAFLKLGRFRSPTLIVDDREVAGTLLEQVDEAMTWFRERLQTRFVITGQPQRDVIWEYPLDAVREAVVNAVCHRDYTSPVNIQIRLYDDRLEVWNPGGLLPPLTPADLLRPHDSVPRNRQIAEVFFYAGLIERWGTGTTRMADALREAGLPDPEFDTGTPGRFTVIMRQNPFTDDRLRAIGLNERQRRAVAYVREHGKITNREYCQLTGVSNVTAHYDCRKLIEAGILQLIGKGRNTAYILR